MQGLVFGRLGTGPIAGTLSLVISNQRVNGGVDTTNLRLIEELQSDARLSLAELGRRVGLSAPAVAERLARLEEDGTIVGYRAEVDPRALGYALSSKRVRKAYDARLKAS